MEAQVDFAVLGCGVFLPALLAIPVFNLLHGSYTTNDLFFQHL
jgi:hypothetical protein